MNSSTKAAINQSDEIKAMKRRMSAEMKRLNERVRKTSEARRALQAGSSRARVTTANARWSIACEARDRFVASMEAQS